MPARIRLQRHGKKGNPFYHIVIADGRAPRDGKFIERIGTYNPLAIPAEINIDFDKALAWLNKGAQPSDTAKAILSYKGVIFKNHLLKGVAKGALTLEQAEAKFQVWMQEKETKILAKKNEIVLTKKEKQKKRHEDEIKANLAKAQEVAKKKAKELAKELAVEETPAEVEAAEEMPVEENVVETPVAEEAVAETPVAEENVVETPVVDEVIAETAIEEVPKIDDAPVTEEPAEEKPE